MSFGWDAPDDGIPSETETVARAEREMRAILLDDSDDGRELRKSLVLSGIAFPEVERAFLRDSATGLDYWRSEEYPYPCYAASEFAGEFVNSPIRLVNRLEWDGDPDEAGWFGRFTVGRSKRIWIITGGAFNWSINPETGIKCES